ncbi:MAG: hypothetical protein RDU24_05950 [Humidesulfovibrio sp.]|uniref:hypothetical protein n=1 Tax=Humidesulfovibrio sp. TaxID=2910988 RepID=UPI0027EFFD67|nr:hypothetical protein [Humidesulfovibrio sp.]MDQ7834906.1 hypothetical protein [Humidesulfovibrio sp.]
MKFSALLLSLALCAALGGCIGVGTLRPDADSSGELTIAPDSKVKTDASGDVTFIPQGLTMPYPESPETVFQAAQTALRLMGLDVVEVDPSRHYILAEHGLSAFSNGENVGVYFAPQQGGTLVTVTSKAKTPTNLFVPDHSKGVHERLSAVLAAKLRH